MFSPDYKSNVEGVLWPAMPSRRGAAVMAMMRQLDESQWWSPEKIREHQNRQLAHLLEHARKTVPYYKKLWGADKSPPDPASDAWQEIPLLTRQRLQQAGGELVSRQLPESHGKASLTRTSGSLGMPVEAQSTDVTRFMWDVFTMRDHIWHQREYEKKLAVLRFLPEGKAIYPDVMELRGWGCVAGDIFKTGPASLINIRSNIKDIVRWLNAEQPEYLMCYPTMADELIRNAGSLGLELEGLKEIRTISEAVTPELRDACRDSFGAKLVDVYSTIEIGYMALQCPENEHYHIQSENVLVELLNERDEPCQPGEVGRVVVTSLHNFATPLIRYEIGDLAVAGETCSCGRGLPVLKRILGRYRNLLTLPDGSRLYPEFAHHRYKVPARQVQMVQTGLEDITVRLVIERKMESSEETELTNLIHELLKYPFNLNFEYVDELRRSDNGKFEEFISDI